MWKRKSYYVYFFILLWICFLTSHHLICDPHSLILLTQACNINMTMSTKNVWYSTTDFVFSSYGISIKNFTILGWRTLSIGQAIALFCRNLHCVFIFNFSLLLLLSRFSRVWLCNPIDGSPPGSAVPGILQARTLEWVAISVSNARKWKVKVKSLSRAWLLGTPWTAAYQAPPSMGSSRQEYWSGVPLPSLNFSLAVIYVMKLDTGNT